MRFLQNGPEIPNELVEAQERGEVLFVCGAGVSRAVGLPGFKKLVQGIYQELGEQWADHPAEREGMEPGGQLFGQYDRVIHSLERRLAAADVPRQRGMRERIRNAIRTLLAPPARPLINHLTLLKLSRGLDGQTRLLTTNFDTLFERAWLDATGLVLPSHAGPAMPAPNTASFAGVLHLHGRLADTRPPVEETDLVLTSSEFGEAYLRSGWASRYVYDAARACHVVLVGYEADDPPMRYLLEVLEEDRLRYNDLRPVHAFVHAPAAGRDTKIALWEAKGVRPIQYDDDPEASHRHLYETLAEWSSYADDPTAWRRTRLGAITGRGPSQCPPEEIQEAVSLLSHGDATELLGAISPAAAWLSVFSSHRVFDRSHSNPGRWIASRITDPEMIRASAGLTALDDQSRWDIRRALERTGETLGPLLARAWRIILAARSSQPADDFGTEWHEERARVRRGQTDAWTRDVVVRAILPRLRVGKPYLMADEARPRSAQIEHLHQLLSIDYESPQTYAPPELINDWPRDLEQEISLLRALCRSLDGALEEAADVGFTDGYDGTNADVPSVAVHPQNAYRSGFYPIVRIIADLWVRVLEKSREKARLMALPWAHSPFRLTRRLYLHALSFPDAYAPAEAVEAILALDDDDFWLSGAQREIMRLLAERWAELDEAARSRVERRIRDGMRRDQFRPDAFPDNDEWASVRDHAIFRRLNRLRAVGPVTLESTEFLERISRDHPKWEPGAGDRDDFHSWHEERSGPLGDPSLLLEVDDASLVQEALRIQQESAFENRDVWRLLCQADPDRALVGLRAEGAEGRWPEEAWRPFLWAANESKDREFQADVAGLLLEMPEASLVPNLSTIASWLQKVRELLDQELLLRVWDRLAPIAYRPDDVAASVDLTVDDDVGTRALNETGGIVAWIIVDTIAAGQPKAGSRIPADLSRRLTRAVQAKGRQGLLARAFVARHLAYFDAVDPVWAHEHLVPAFSWRNAEAPFLWAERAHDHVGSSRLFNALKEPFLRSFEQPEFKTTAIDGLAGHLVSAAMWRRRPESQAYELTDQEVKRALAASPRARKHCAWQLWRWMSASDEGHELDRAARWRDEVGPLFRAIWPADAAHRDEDTSHDLVSMALDCDAAFPDAVDTIADFVVPYRLWSLNHSVLHNRHRGLPARFPRAFVTLLNAIIDPSAHPLPPDLDPTLRECAAADPQLANEPAFIRLRALARRTRA